ncbi:hypothetical protein PG993_012961 [Apiospora rasikravindrae]|uniref:LYC1 C-terminal domain-containing protein n=1 Tax=Apiospora rasikravindrae TaxID=990691 RepID=A0ABR1RWB1_9PEZI
MAPTIELPADSPDIHLSPQPTPEECIQIWTATAASWKDSLTLPEYIAEAQYLATAPLARDGGMTRWILVNKKLPHGQRQIFCSCETFQKRALVSDERGNVEEGIVHGVASVFCPPEYRGCGYGSRLMKELAKILQHGWQPEYGNKSIGSVLYSDIGKEYYARLGWIPNPRNEHFAFPPVEMEKKSALSAQLIPESELRKLCHRDETTIRKAMVTPGPDTVQKRVVILPDLEHMLWHIRKEDFATEHIFGKKAEAKGAIAGSPGKQVWALWVRRYYKHPDHPCEEDGENVLYIVRLVVEGDNTANKPYEGLLSLALAGAYTEQAAAFHAVLQAAQAEAAEWRLDQVHLWEPSPLVRCLLGQNNLDATWVERHETSVASALWFTDDGNAVDEAPLWVNNEYYAWC